MSAGSAKGSQIMDRLADRFAQRTRLGTIITSWRVHAFTDQWSLLLGQIVVASVVVCTLTGAFLTFFYDPSVTPVIYDGPYGPLQGVEMSRAYESSLEISLEVRGGLLMRQLHRWSANLMIAALLLHILRVFFTGEFRRPRVKNWLIGFGVLFAGLGAGLTGAILPDDMLSGSSLAVLDGLLKSVPVVGTWLSGLVFQGQFPSGAIATLYPVHAFILPGIIVALIAMYAVLGARSRPARPGPGHGSERVVRRRPGGAATKRGGLFLIVFGSLTLMAALVTVNPIWDYGPADPGNTSAGAGALWYLAFLDGAQKLVPPGWDFVWMGGTWVLGLLVPVAVSGLYLMTAMLYPFIERWITGDRREHHRPTRPRNAPTRTAIGVAGMIFYGVLWAAAGIDTIALQFGVAFEGLVLTLQIALLLGPVLGFVLTKRICIGLQRKDRELVLHGHETGRVVRTSTGEYIELHRPLNDYERWRLVDYEAEEPLTLEPDANGRVRWRRRVRVRLSRWFYRDRILPVTPAELLAARDRDAVNAVETAERGRVLEDSR
ncbi:cytochrome bc1 complex cytochrome b subunit [Occultella gossypii]|uniref:Cytochrome bc1 complex cytochrome b subunit n=1 Tax=Occultella gossypii TaxID=2800820 RepID=A0ABS7S675_9MICO|nr:cytochrome b N-terminal domain-containing protein [Occultella gossypii]MBZ2195582.1 ubiquinol-cytochrome c reductase cytochrome b subunit [Occultella gossypii]